MKKFRLPRPATVIACLALVFALGGTAAHAANTVRSGDIVDGEVRSRDVMNRNLKGLDIADNSLGNRVLGANSVTSEQLTGIFTVTSNSTAVSDADGTTNGGQFTHVGATAQCPAGSDLISGGARWVDPSGMGTQNSAVFLQEQYRSGSGNDWTVEGIVDFGAQGNIKLQAQAYCLTAGPLT
jgi:hypothetical protein